ncbi:MAG: hypothetical protein H7343_07640 [Undibacterium sp.]|nr:hypothetical protein [Opitutaceae bacterium]
MKFTIGGAVIGLSCGVGIMAYAFLKSPGRPGFFELLIQFGIVAVLTTSTALLGFLIGWLAGLVWPKKNEKAA